MSADAVIEVTGLRQTLYDLRGHDLIVLLAAGLLLFGVIFRRRDVA